jgi:hypothetical protein
MSAFIKEEADRIVMDYHQQAVKAYEAQHSEPNHIIYMNDWRQWRDAWIKQAMAKEIFRLRNPELTNQ